MGTFVCACKCVYTHSFTRLPNCKASLRDTALTQHQGLESMMANLPLGAVNQALEKCVLPPRPSTCQVCELWSVSVGRPTSQLWELRGTTMLEKAEVPIGLLRSLRKTPGLILGRKEILPMLTGSDKLFLTVECSTINRNSDLVRWLSRDYYFHFMGGGNGGPERLSDLLKVSC